MKLKNKKLLFIVPVLSIGIFVGIRQYRNSNDINYILKNEYYSYLPVEAKDYIKEVYESTGEVLLTEKNKKENKLYLNPDYVEYITLPKDEQEKQAVIPDVYALDYVFNKSYSSSDELPSSYDSRNVDGKNYVTEIRDQGSLDVCWTFATAETAETYLLATKKETVTSNSQLFSERQLDYATSNNGIKDYQSEYRSFIDRKLGSGGNFYVATTALASGISLSDASWKTYSDTDLEQMELYEVLNYNNSLYELNTSINMPRLNVLDLDMTKEENIKLREEYINTIKSNIMKYGSAFVGTGSPTSADGCAYYDSNLSNYVISVDKTCNVKEHAMQIIGWDDNISYSYCADNASKHTTYSSCKNKVSGTGVWILRNSWGNESSGDYPYTYLTYDSYNSDISFITDLEASYEKKWDNNYILGDKFDPVASTEKSFDLDVDNNEKITKIKFMSYSQNAAYNIKITVDGKTLNETYKVSNSQPGLVSIDLTDKNITFKDSVSIKVIGQNDAFLLSQLYLFTTNVLEDAMLSFNIDKSLVIDKVNLRLYSTTKNIESDSKIIYKLYNKENKDMSDKMTFTNNIVAENNVNTSIVLDESLPKGDYKIDAIFQEKVLDSIYIINEISGSGTEEDPYVITNSDQLYDIRDDLDAYYVLGNDIDLTEDTRSGGKYYNEGYGWIGATKFSGTLDGQGHTIKGAWISKNNLAAGGYGLFRSIAGDVTIKNLIIEDFDMTCDYWCGALAGSYGDDVNYENGTNNINISNIVIRNSSIVGYKKNDSAYSQNHRIGGLIGGIYAPNSTVNISNIYMDASVDYVINQSNPRAGGAGLIKNVVADNFTVRNIQINGNIIEPKVLFKEVKANTNIQEYIINTADKTVDLSSLTKKETYSSWDDFDDNWVIKTIDGIPRIPILKIAEDKFEYTSVNDISIELAVDEYPSLYDYIIPDSSLAHRISYEIEENDVVIIDDGTLKPLSPGTTTIHVKNYFDGYEKDVPVTVTHKSETPYYVVVFHSNGIDKEPISKIYNMSLNGNQLISNPYSRNNYDFVGWNTKKDGTGTAYSDREKIIPDIENGGVIVLYAQWKAKKKKVTFDPNGGIVDTVTKEFDYDSYYGDELPIATRDGFGFGGWVYQKNNREYIISPSTIVNDIDSIEVTAKWIDNSYTIIYNQNGGQSIYYEISGPYEKKYSIATFGVDKSIFYNYLFTRKGYTFKEWNTKEDGTGDSYKPGDIINFSSVENSVFNLYAIWEKDQISITFNSNDDSNTTNVQTFDYTDKVKLNKNTFTRDGYIFGGWSTEKDGTGIIYQDEEEITIDDNLVLYAIWIEDKTYVINKYSVDEDNKYIDLIDVGTTVDEFKENISLATNFRVEVEYKEVNGKKLLYTGGKVKIYKDDKLYSEYLCIIRGDVNGNAIIDIIDYIRIMKDIMNTSKLSGVYYKAADVNQNGNIDIIDYIRIMKKIMEEK